LRCRKKTFSRTSPGSPVKSSSFEVEFAAPSAGVNAVPKRGSASLHGELKTYYQTSSLDANYLAGQRVSLLPPGAASLVCGLRLDYGGSLAGRGHWTRQDVTPQ